MVIRKNRKSRTDSKDCILNIIIKHNGAMHQVVRHDSAGVVKVI